MAGRAHLGLTAGLAGGVCAIVGVLAAQAWWGRSGRRTSVPDGHAEPMAWTSPRVPTTAPTSVTTLAAGALEELGLRPLESDPTGAMAPPGARRVYAMQRDLPTGAVDQVVYVAPGPLRAAEEFYRTRLRQRGYELARTGATMNKDGGVSLVFLKGRERWVVMLHPTDNADKVKIVLVIARAGG